MTVPEPLKTRVPRPMTGMSHAFFPDADRARLLDRRMRSELALSLGYLHESIAAQWGQDLPGICNLAEDMRRGAIYPPSTFGLYYELTDALLADRREEAMSLIDELAGERPLADERVAVLALDALPTERIIGRYQRLMDTDPNDPFRIRSVSPGQAAAFADRFYRVQERLRRLTPALADEFQALVRQIVLAVADGQDTTEFAGGSCYMLWGALLLNADAYADDVTLIEAMAHESGHSLLFGLTNDEPLVLNDAGELFDSPLRDDPRPMDGIFHATYVSARMHWAMSALLASGGLDPQETARAQAARDSDVQQFKSGYDTVMTHGRLTGAGKAILAGAAAYMSV
jgi:HEXXH motif-containing protein